jgi:hypothetical protein
MELEVGQERAGPWCGLAKKAVLFFCLACSITGNSQELLKVSRLTWEGLSPVEKASIQQRHTVDIREAGTYGVIIDNQGVNESTPGTNGGAALGGSFAEAAYVDRAIRNGSYSAKNQLAVGILGAVLGSSLDKPAIQQFHFRYAIKLATGDIIFRDSVQSEPFRLPAGLCIDVASVAPLSQELCSQTTASLRAKLLAEVAIAPAQAAVRAQLDMKPAEASPATNDVKARPMGNIECKVTNLAPFSTTAEKCQAIGGKLL